MKYSLKTSRINKIKIDHIIFKPLLVTIHSSINILMQKKHNVMVCITINVLQLKLVRELANYQYIEHIEIQNGVK